MIPKCPHLFDLSWWLGSANALPLDFWCIPSGCEKIRSAWSGMDEVLILFYSYFWAEGDRICIYQGQNQSIMVVNEEKRMVFLHLCVIELESLLAVFLPPKSVKILARREVQVRETGERVEEEKWDFLVYKVVDFRSEGWTHTLKVSVHLAKW